MGYVRQDKLIRQIEHEYEEPVADVLQGFSDMGYSMNYTAGVLGVSYDTLDRLAEKHGVTFPFGARPPMSEEQRRKLSLIKQQSSRIDNRLYTAKGITMHLSAWARELGVYPSTIVRRIEDYNWPVEKAVTTPSTKPKGGALGKSKYNHPWRN